MSKATLETVKVDDKNYNIADLDESALAQLRSIRFADEQIQLASNQQALAELAKRAYMQALAENLPQQQAAANLKKDVITIDGNRYKLGDFSDPAKSQLAGIQFSEQEINRLKNQKALLQTARAQYARTLSGALEQLTPVAD